MQREGELEGEEGAARREPWDQRGALVMQSPRWFLSRYRAPEPSRLDIKRINLRSNSVPVFQLDL